MVYISPDGGRYTSREAYEHYHPEAKKTNNNSNTNTNTNNNKSGGGGGSSNEPYWYKYYPKPDNGGATNPSGTNVSGNSGGSSGGSKSGNTTVAPTDITSKNSYNGEYIKFNTGVDYQDLINKAVASGNMSDAAKYEAQRNEKIKYLNGLGQNTDNYTTTDNYTKVYADASGNGYKNNQGGDVYTNTYSSPSDLGKTVLGTGQTITQVNNGNAQYRLATKGNGERVIQQKVSHTGNEAFDWEDVGNGVNGETGEFTMTPEQAKKAYVSSLMGYTDYADTGEDKLVQYDNLSNAGNVNNDYMTALQSGNVNEWRERLLANVPVEDTPQQAQTQIDNSFERDTASGMTPTERDIKNVEERRYRTADEYADANNIDFGNTDIQTATNYSGNWRMQGAEMPTWVQNLVQNFNVPVDAILKSYR